MAATITYPLSVVSTVSCVSGSSLAAAKPPNMPTYISWLGVLRHLRDTVRYSFFKLKASHLEIIMCFF